jgi:hypothetical protein
MATDVLLVSFHDMAANEEATAAEGLSVVVGGDGAEAERTNDSTLGRIRCSDGGEWRNCKAMFDATAGELPPKLVRVESPS